MYNRVKELREDNDLLQRQIAEALGISQRNYSYIETGQTLLTEDILRKLANYYETSIDYILYRTDERNAYPDSLLEKDFHTKIRQTRKKATISMKVYNEQK